MPCHPYCGHLQNISTRQLRGTHLSAEYMTEFKVSEILDSYHILRSPVLSDY